MKRLLVVAGEGSGDALAAPVLSALHLNGRAFGLGGPALRDAGLDLVARLDTIAAMGIGGVARRAPALALALGSLVHATIARRPDAALLVGFSEANQRLAPWLRRRGVRVLWLSPPQTWAWRAARSGRIASACDRLAVVLPFEKAWWERAAASRCGTPGGVEHPEGCSAASVDYVGHPASSLPFAATTFPPKEGPVQIALLPGSRAHEVRAHLPVMLDAVRSLRRRGPVEARLVRAPVLRARIAGELARLADESSVPVTTAPIAEALRSAHAALCASGTATLECAAMGVPPVIVYRTDALTYAVARHAVRVPHIGLPNLLLGRRQFPELVQRDATAPAIADACAAILETHAVHREACLELRRLLTDGLDARRPEERVATLLAPWLE